jgi:hypothetical protein
MRLETYRETSPPAASGKRVMRDRRGRVPRDVSRAPQPEVDVDILNVREEILVENFPLELDFLQRRHTIHRGRRAHPEHLTGRVGLAIVGLPLPTIDDDTVIVKFVSR